MIYSIDCEDAYEAEKLAGMTAVQKNGSTFVAGITSIIGPEVIVKLNDGSSHSVMLADRTNAGKLKEIIGAVASGKFAVLSTAFSGRTAEIRLVRTGPEGEISV